MANLKIVPNYCGEKPSLSKYKMQKNIHEFTTFKVHNSKTHPFKTHACIYVVHNL